MMVHIRPEGGSLNCKDKMAYKGATLGEAGSADHSITFLALAFA
jgi:hypothetical protein